jgi:hypothetical protein
MIHNVALASLAIAALITGLIAAYYRWKSSNVPVPRFETPVASVEDNPADHTLTNSVNIDSINSAFGESSRLNKLAARWTAVSVVIGAATTFLGMFH